MTPPTDPRLITAAFGTNAGPGTPGTAYVMAHHMFAATAGVRGRAGYVRGGMGGLADALAKAAARHGAELRSGAEVRRIVVENGNARGVELADGQRIEATVVVSNADPQRTFLSLIDREALSPGFRAGIEDIEMQGVALKVKPHSPRHQRPGLAARAQSATDWVPPRSVLPQLHNKHLRSTRRVSEIWCKI